MASPTPANASPAPAPAPTEDSPKESLLARLPLEHIPATHRVHAALFRDVKNAGFLHAQLLARNPAFEYAFVDASAVASTTHVQAAAFRAVVASLGEGGPRTANVHSEIVFCLSPSNNITEAFRRYGISPTTKDVIAIKVLTSPSSSPADAEGSTPQQNPTPSPDDVWAHLRDNVEGTAVPFTDDNIAPATDWAKVRKYYKLNGAAALQGFAAKDEAARRRESEMLILGAMALRGV